MITRIEAILRNVRAARTIESEATDNGTTAEYKMLAVAATWEQISRMCLELASEASDKAIDARISADKKATTRKAERQANK